MQIIDNLNDVEYSLGATCCINLNNTLTMTNADIIHLDICLAFRVEG